MDILKRSLIRGSIYSLDHIEKLLDKGLFFRINRKLIIHIDAIKKITTYYNSRFILQLQPGVAVDANTNANGSRNGDGVYRRMRHKRTIHCLADWAVGSEED